MITVALILPIIFHLLPAHDSDKFYPPQVSRKCEDVKCCISVFQSLQSLFYWFCSASSLASFTRSIRVENIEMSVGWRPIFWIWGTQQYKVMTWVSKNIFLLTDKCALLCHMFIYVSSYLDYMWLCTHGIAPTCSPKYSTSSASWRRILPSSVSPPFAPAVVVAAAPFLACFKRFKLSSIFLTELSTSEMVS